MAASPLPHGTAAFRIAGSRRSRATRTLAPISARWLLRIEYVVVPRAGGGSEADLVGTLARSGFGWHGPMERQSARTPRYAAALDALVAHDLAYPCGCSRRDLEAAVLGPGGERVYLGTRCSVGRRLREIRSPRARVARAGRRGAHRVRRPAARREGAGPRARRRRLRRPARGRPLRLSARGGRRRRRATGHARGARRRPAVVDAAADPPAAAARPAAGVVSARPGRARRGRREIVEADRGARAAARSVAGAHRGVALSRPAVAGGGAAHAGRFLVARRARMDAAPPAAAGDAAGAARARRRTCSPLDFRTLGARSIAYARPRLHQ